jgi:hypothetical protein
VSEPGESCDKGQAKAIIIGTDPPWTAQPAGDHCAARKAGLIARSILPSFSSLYGKGGTAQCEREERAIKTEVCPQERDKAYGDRLACGQRGRRRAPCGSGRMTSADARALAGPVCVLAQSRTRGT